MICQHNATRQQGITLVVCLILLLAISAGTISGMNNSIVQERIVQNHKERSKAHQAAETALRVAEERIKAQQGMGDLQFSANRAGFYERDANRSPNWTDDDMNHGNGYVSLPPQKWAGFHSPPGYYIELLDDVMPPGSTTQTSSKNSNSKFYRITAFGTGSLESSRVVVRVVYRVN